jgi:ribosomal protein S24E
METEKNFKNEAIKRHELVFMLESEKNPSFLEIKKKLSEEFKKPEENIDVLRVKGSFGSKKFRTEAHIYDNKEDLEKAISRRFGKKKKEALKKNEQEAKKAAEAPKEEKPAE